MADGSLEQGQSSAACHVMLGPDVVGGKDQTCSIAEIGNNRNGDFFLAKRLIGEAARAGANAVKFQKRSVEDNLERVEVPFYKIAPFDVTNLPLIDYVAAIGKPIILSTGMSSAEDVRRSGANHLRPRDES